MNPLLVALVPMLMTLLLYYSAHAERSLQEVPIDVPKPEDEPAEPEL